MKKSSAKFWRVLKRTLSAAWKLALVVIGICMAIAVHEEFHLSRWCSVDALSENLMMRTHRLGYVRLFDATTGKKISSQKFRSVSCPSLTDSLTVFQSMDGMRGYLNANTGEVVIPARYKHAWIFSEGIGAVVDADDSLRFIGHDGMPLFGKAFDYSTDYEYVFHDGHCIVTGFTEDGCVMGLIDTRGEWTVPQIYYDITKIWGEDLYKVSIRNEDGSNRHGLLDLSGNWILPVEYQGIDFSNCDNSLYLTKDYVKQHVSADGKVLEPFVIDLMVLLDYSALGEQPVNDEGETYAINVSSAVVAKYYANSLCGLLDLRTGRPLTTARFSDIFMVSGDVIRCQLEGSLSEVIYNSRGEMIK